MDVIHMPKRGFAPDERTIDVPKAGTGHATTLPPPSQKVRDALEAGIVSRRMIFPENAADSNASRPGIPI